MHTGAIAPWGGPGIVLLIIEFCSLLYCVFAILKFMIDFCVSAYYFSRKLMYVFVLKEGVYYNWVNNAEV